MASLDEARNNARAELGGLQGALRDTLADGALSGSERRLQAQEIARGIMPALGVLEDGAPANLLGSFASRLMQQDGPAREDQLLAALGAQIASASGPVQASQFSAPPAFPMPTGVSDTLRFIPHFLPIALLVAVCELILPITLWLYAFIDLRARLDQQERTAPRPARQRTARKTQSNRRPT